MSATESPAPAVAERPSQRGNLLALFAVALPLFGIDQLSKWWIVTNFAPLEERVVIPDYFNLCYWMNTNAAFSLGLFNDPRANNAFFIALSAAALVALLVFYRFGAFRDSPSQWASALLMAGILGNLTDRLVHGSVVDFLLFDLHVRFAHPWPAFNIADSCIFVAVALFIIASLREGKGGAASQVARSD